MPLRILIVGPARSIALEQWVSEMVRRGHDVLVMSPDSPREAIAGRCETTEAGPRIPVIRFLSRIRHIRRRIRESRPHVVHGQGAFDYGLWAVLASSHPTWVSCWGSDVLLRAKESWANRVKVRTALRGADYVTATSAHLLEEAESIARRTLGGEVISE